MDSRKFHSYLYSLPTCAVETNNKLLIATIKKNVSGMSPRIQRLMMKLQRYDFNPIYTPGKVIVRADALSRATAHSESSTETDVNLLTESPPLSRLKSRHVAEETKKDIQVQEVIKNRTEGWPGGECQQFFNKEPT